MNYYLIHTKLKHCRNPKFTYYQVCFSYLFFFYEILLTWWPLAGEVIRASSGQGCQSCKAKAMHTNFYVQESFTFNSGRNSVAGEVTPGAGKKITFSDSFEQAVISLALERVSWVFFACLFVCLLVCFVPSSEENHFHRRLTWKETSWQIFFPPHQQWFAAYLTCIRPSLQRRLGRAAAGQGLFFLGNTGDVVAGLWKQWVYFSFLKQGWANFTH